MSKKIGWLLGVLALSFFSVTGMPARAADTPGTFVFSPFGDEATFNNWAKKGFVLKKVLTDYYNNSTFDTVKYFTFDDSNRLTKLEIDYDYDGTIDNVDTYTYNNAGNISRVDIDSDNNGEVDATVTYYFNTDNSVSYLEIDMENNGTPDTKVTCVYLDGKLEQLLTDENYDGETDSMVRYLWWGDFWVSKQIDADNDGFGDNQEYYSYNDSGNISLVEVDYDYDGVYDYAGGFFYDSNGVLTTHKKDYDNDGNFDVVETYVWSFSVDPVDPDDPDDPDNEGSSSSSASCFLNSLNR